MYTYKRRLHDVRYQANKTADNFFTKINIIANTANKQKMPYGLKCAIPATNGLKLRLNCIIYLQTHKSPCLHAASPYDGNTTKTTTNKPEPVHINATTPATSRHIKNKSGKKYRYLFPLTVGITGEDNNNHSVKS